MTPVLRRAALVSALAALPAAAQFSVIKGGSGDGVTRMTGPNMRAMAAAADGTLWTILYQQDTGATRRELFLRRSLDGGKTWAGKFVVPLPAGHRPNSLASIHMDRRCDRLHVVYSAGNPSFSAYHIEFDARARTWVGQPALISTRATSTNSQMYGKDVVVTDAGTVVVLMQTHRGPPPNWASFRFGGWAAGIRVRKAGASAFGPRIQINKEVYGVTPNMIAVGEIVHFSFRSNFGGYGINYRAFDTVTGRFVHDDVRVGPNNNAGIQACNDSHIAVDDKGGLYVLYATPGRLRFAYSKPGPHDKNGNWADAIVTTDRGIRGGNVTQRFYGLSRGSVNAVYAVYAKPSEKLVTLYMRIYVDGKPIGPEIPVVKTTTPNRFEWITGVRNNHVATGARYFTWGRLKDPASGPGQVDYFRPGGGGRALIYGAGCRGSRSATPRLAAVGAPVIGRPLRLQITDSPASNPGAFVVSAACAARPLDLGGIGMPGCAIHPQIALTLPFVASAAGLVSFPAAVPNNPGLENLGVHFQGVAIAPGANPGGAVVSNALAAIF